MNFLSFGEVSTACCHFAVYLQRIPQISTEESFMSTPDLANLAACTEDARVAALDTDPGPPNPTKSIASAGDWSPLGSTCRHCTDRRWRIL